MLTNFRLMATLDPRQLQHDRSLSRLPVVYALCFDIDGQLTRVGWSSYAGQRIPNVIAEQAADVKELWIAEISIDDLFDARFDFNRENTVRRFGRGVQTRLQTYRVRNEYFRVPMRMVDDAFGMQAVVRDAVRQAA